MPLLKRHIFICTNERPADHPRGCCHSKGSEEVRTACKEELGRRGLKGIVRANQAGCLDQCAYGVTMVIYPDAIWYGGVTAADVPEIFAKTIDKGEVIERLRIPTQYLNTPIAANGPKPKG